MGLSVVNPLSFNRQHYEIDDWTGEKQGRLLKLFFSIHMHNYNWQFLQF